MTDTQEEKITNKVFDMLGNYSSIEETIKAIGVKGIEVDKDEFDLDTIITIHYQDGQIISHWV